MCGDPYLPDINGGAYDWNETEMGNNRSPFNTVVTYSCVPGARFSNTKDATRTKKYICQWDQTWTTSDTEAIFLLVFYCRQNMQPNKIKII